MSPAVTAMNSSAGMTITAATIAVMPPAPMPVFLGGCIGRYCWYGGIGYGWYGGWA